MTDMFYAHVARLAPSARSAVPTSIVSAFSTVEVFTRNPGHGLCVIPRRPGSLDELSHQLTPAY
ncbi:hypothetical protein JYU34_017614 [Plutella xylostella]|uniref:Uncharacterized protein n=1 Tax=Plutella xylostella TaxID=51655 RepID=A0ABQ7PPN2_PLUXY|nr:hypothetical protein JYU34_022655 [Plutella xylostella]KAG7298210.1 hypothetical protein JYU34_019021 [Plutella xylostella]KAG7298649.1 hypothetical protein JYU34_018303 [Plutella xylostella]KAG7299109.1 hypothetical protein JYU34_017614 [Plutella xylostella]